MCMEQTEHQSFLMAQGFVKVAVETGASLVPVRA